MTTIILSTDNWLQPRYRRLSKHQQRHRSPPLRPSNLPPPPPPRSDTVKLRHSTDAWWEMVFIHVGRNYTYAERVTLNPFTAMLAATSRRKRPIEMPNLKRLRLFPLSAWARERTSIRKHCTQYNTIQYNCISKCQYTDCTRNVLCCQVHSSHTRSNHKTFNYNNSK